MLFSSLSFLYCFLPLCVGAYFLAPPAARNGVLLGASILFYGWGEPRYLALLGGTVLFFYLCGLGLERRPGRFFLVLSAVGGLAGLGLFKYADFFLASFRQVTGLPVPLLRLSLPMGISFYTFQCLSYTADLYRGRVKAQHSLLDFACYVTLFPQLVAGPIVRYADIDRELHARSAGWEELRVGGLRFLVGLGKKVLLADTLAALVQAAQTGSGSALAGWLGSVGFTLQIYFDFSGYSDMAIGLGRVFGFRFGENFRTPYCSRSITEFWRRWHISLGAWFRDYLYIPLGGNRVSALRWVGNILTVWMLTGLWHGAGWNFVLWGLLYALLLLAEKALPALRRLPGALAHLYVLFFVNAGFVLFEAESLSAAGAALGQLLGLGVPLWDVWSLYLLKTYAGLLAVGALASTGLPARVAAALPGRAVLRPLLAAGLLLLSTAALVSGSYSPFLYFRF